MWIQSSGDPKVSVDEGPWRALELGGFQWFFRCQQPTRMIPKVGLCEFLVGIHLGLGKLGLIIGKLRHLQIKLDFLRYWCAGTSPELQTTNHKHQLTTILYIYICIYVRIYYIILPVDGYIQLQLYIDTVVIGWLEYLSFLGWLGGFLVCESDGLPNVQVLWLEVEKQILNWLHNVDSMILYMR